MAVAVDAHILRAVATRNRDPVLNPAALALHLGVNGLAIRLLLSGRQCLLWDIAASPSLRCPASSMRALGNPPAAVVRHLRERRIVASVAPYAVPHVRLTPCVQNTRAEIATVLRELQALAS